VTGGSETERDARTTFGRAVDHMQRSDQSVWFAAAYWEEVVLLGPNGMMDAVTRKSGVPVA